ARRFGPVDLDDAPARQPTDAEREIEPERAGRHDLDVARCNGIAEPHHGALAKLLLDLTQRCRKGFLAVLVHSIFLQGYEWRRRLRITSAVRGLFHRFRAAAAAVFPAKMRRILRCARTSQRPLAPRLVVHVA